MDKPDIAVIKVRISSARIADVEDHVAKWRGEGGEDSPTANGLVESAVDD